MTDYRQSLRACVCETLLQGALLHLLESRTTRVGAHRLSSISSRDLIVVLDNGKIIATGSHDYLLKLKDGQYKKLWNRQSGAFIEESKSAVK